MAAFILLLFGFVLIESSEAVQCFNDYDTELKCSFIPAQSENCSEHRLETVIDKKHGLCRFGETHLGACECAIHVVAFVLTETFTINVSKGDDVWWTKSIRTEESIKPRKPIITSVDQNANEDVKVTVDTTYTTYNTKPFRDSLIVELTYNIQGSDKNTTMFLKEGSTEDYILSRNLQPNSRYVLRARMKSTYPYNKMLSDYSEPYEFKTPLSLQNTAQIIVPIFCIILLICISSIYFWFNRVLKPWWDEIPTPNFSTHFVKQVPQLLSLQTEFSSVNLDSTANYINKQTCPESCEVQDEGRQYSFLLGKGVDSAPLIYSTPCYEALHENGSEKVRCAKELGPSMNERAFENKSYWQSSCGKELHPAVNVPSENLLVSAKNSGPAIYMDDDYCVWNGCTDSGTSKLVHIVPVNATTEVVFGYQSITWSDPITEEPFNAKELQDVTFPVHGRIAMDEDYQAF